MQLFEIKNIWTSRRGR